MNENLKLCPFCGNDSPHNHNISGAVWCDDCHSVSNDHERWNTRPLEDALLKRAEAAEARVAELEAEHNDALETVEKLGRELGKLRTDYDLCYERLIEMEAASRWIPVSERLPKEKQNVLGLDRTGTAYHWEYSKSLVNIFTADFTHWMPLPEPPKPEGEK